MSNLDIGKSAKYFVSDQIHSVFDRNICRDDPVSMKLFGHQVNVSLNGKPSIFCESCVERVFHFSSKNSVSYLSVKVTQFIK